MNNSNWQDKIRGEILGIYYQLRGEVSPPFWFGKVVDRIEPLINSHLEEERQGLVNEVLKIRSATISTCEEGDAVDREDVLYLLTKKE